MKYITFILFLFPVVCHADFYVGFGTQKLTQDIGLQAQNDTPLDDVSAPDNVNQHGCGPNCVRFGADSPVQSSLGGNLYFGWRSGRSALEFGYADLGTWQLIGGIQKDSGFARSEKLNVTMDAVHASFLGYTKPFYGFEAFGRIGMHMNRVHEHVNYRDFDSNHPEVSAHTTLFELNGVKCGTLFGIGIEYPMETASIRLEVKRFNKVGIIDYTGQTDVRVIEFGALKRF